MSLFTVNHSKLKDGYNKLHIISFFCAFLHFRILHPCISELHPFLFIHFVGCYPAFIPGGCSKRENVSGTVEQNDGVKAGGCLYVTNMMMVMVANERCQCSNVSDLPACRAGGSWRVGALRTAHLEVERLTPLSLSESVCALQWHSLFMSDVIESEWMAQATEPVHQKRPSGECGMLDDIFLPLRPSRVE